MVYYELCQNEGSVVKDLTEISCKGAAALTQGIAPATLGAFQASYFQKHILEVTRHHEIKR